AGDPEDQHRRRDQPHLAKKPPTHVRAGVDEARRVEGREIRRDVIVVVLESPEGGVNDERKKHQERDERLDPPGVFSERRDVLQSYGTVAHSQLLISCRRTFARYSIEGYATRTRRRRRADDQVM